MSPSAWPLQSPQVNFDLDLWCKVMIFASHTPSWYEEQPCQVSSQSNNFKNSFAYNTPSWYDMFPCNPITESKVMQFGDGQTQAHMRVPEERTILLCLSHGDIKSHPYQNTSIFVKPQSHDAQQTQMLHCAQCGLVSWWLLISYLMANTKPCKTVLIAGHILQCRLICLSECLVTW